MGRLRGGGGGCRGHGGGGSAGSIFARLAEAERERLARAAADITLAAGRVRGEEGDERAIFALLEGRIEAVKASDGIDRVVGERLPGDIFGEVSMVLGTVFPVGFRAAEAVAGASDRARPTTTMSPRSPRTSPRRSARWRPKDERSAWPRRASPPSRGRRARSWSASAPTPRAPCCGTSSTAIRSASCGCRPTRRTPPSTGAVRCRLRATVRSIRLVGGKTVVRPQLRRVAELLGLGTEPHAAEYDTVVVGAGPSGLAAAVYGASEGLRTLVVEREAPGGQAGTSSRIENYLGFPSGVSGDELASRALQQARRLGAEILVTRTITRIDAGSHEVHLDGGDILQLEDDHPRVRRLLAAAGHRGLRPARRQRASSTALHAARRRTSHGLDIHIVGAGNSAGQAAMFFSTHARSVTVLYRGDSLEKRMSRYLVDQLAAPANIEVRLHTEVVAAHGEIELESIDVRDSATGEPTRLASGGLFIFIGADAETGWLPPEIALDRRGYVLTGSDVDGRRRLAARARPVPARDERSRHLRLRRRALGAGQARRGRGGRGQHGDRLRAPVPARA